MPKPSAKKLARDQQEKLVIQACQRYEKEVGSVENTPLALVVMALDRLKITSEEYAFQLLTKHHKEYIKAKKHYESEEAKAEFKKPIFRVKRHSKGDSLEDGISFPQLD